MNYELSSCLWPLFAALTGLCAGSLLTVVIYRLPLMLMDEERRFFSASISENDAGSDSLRTGEGKPFNLFLPRSHCPQCKTTVAARDNIPVISWLILRGRCRHCHQPIHWRYPLIETVTMLLALYWAYSYPPNMQWLLLMVFSGILLTLALIDVEYQILPDTLTCSLLWTGLIWHCLFDNDFLVPAISGAIAGYMTLWSLFWIMKFLTKREGLGYGDFKFLAALGAWFGWQALPELLLVAASAGIASHILFHGISRQTRHKPIPFGPGLALAGVWMSTVSPVMNIY